MLWSCFSHCWSSSTHYLYKLFPLLALNILFILFFFMKYENKTTLAWNGMLYIKWVTSPRESSHVLSSYRLLWEHYMCCNIFLKRDILSLALSLPVSIFRCIRLMESGCQTEEEVTLWPLVRQLRWAVSWRAGPTNIYHSDFLLKDKTKRKY